MQSTTPAEDNAGACRQDDGSSINMMPQVGPHALRGLRPRPCVPEHISAGVFKLAQGRRPRPLRLVARAAPVWERRPRERDRRSPFGSSHQWSLLIHPAAGGCDLKCPLPSASPRVFRAGRSQPGPWSNRPTLSGAPIHSAEAETTPRAERRVASMAT